MAFEVILHEIFSEFASIAQALKATVHIAGVAKILEADDSLSTAKVLFLQVKLFEGDWTPPYMFLFEFTLGFVVFPILFEAFHAAVSNGLALAKLQILSFVAFLASALLSSGYAVPIYFLALYVEVPFADGVDLLEILGFSHLLPSFPFIKKNLPLAPSSR